ncbi:HPr kinase/phosphorylase [Chelativorans sp. YIM 93263]|uniref:HPr kinase/phosphorylase n=1 Tax=Chelativorans sp. YIM 93263 TaxID=2906648 RepID=UPI0023785BD4|nr:HPr kinase/phosphorylase [Chelativorans sp. YIM 93263]
MSKANAHGTLVIADTHGVLITGPSGAGKSALALEIIRYCAEYGRLARLICDDQVLLGVHNGRVLGRAAPSIAGQIEARGYGPVSIAHEPAAVIDLVVQIAPGSGHPARLQYDEEAVVIGVPLPSLQCSRHDMASAVRAIAARLRLPPFADDSSKID